MIRRQSWQRAVRQSVQRALACLLSGSVPLLAAAEEASAGADPPAQASPPAAPTSDLQQRLQRLEESQQALQRQLQENASEIDALKKQAGAQARRRDVVARSRGFCGHFR